jgi:hypothetical protein
MPDWAKSSFQATGQTNPTKRVSLATMSQGRWQEDLRLKRHFATSDCVIDANQCKLPLPAKQFHPLPEKESAGGD